MPTPPKGSTASKLPNNKDTRRLTPKEWIAYNEGMGYERVPSQAVYPSFKDPNASYEIPGNPNDHLPYISFNSDWPPKPTPLKGTQPVQMNPGNTYNPNTGQYFNPVTQAEIQPIIEQYYKGGNVKDGDDPKKKKKNDPIYVTDPNDPKLRAYNDSLNNYNKYTSKLDNARKTGKWPKYGYDLDLSKERDLTVDEKIQENLKSLKELTGNDYQKGDISLRGISKTGLTGFTSFPMKSVVSENTISKNDSNSTTLRHEKDITYGDYYFPKYAQPQQPIEFIDGPEKLTPKTISFSEPELRKSNIKDALIKLPEYSTQIETTPNFQMKHKKDSTGKIIDTKYYDFNGNEISEIINQYYKGGNVKGYGNGTNPYGVQPTVSGYQSPYTQAGQNTNQPNRSGQGAKAAGAISSTANVLGWANQAKDAVQQGFDKDEYGYINNDNQRALNEVITPTYKHVGDKIKEGDWGGAFKEQFLGAQYVRAAQNVLGNSNKDTKFNKFFGVGEDAKEAEKMRLEDEKLRQDQLKEERKLTEDSILQEKMALRDMGVTGLKDEYIADPAGIPQEFLNTAVQGFNQGAASTFQNTKGGNPNEKVFNMSANYLRQLNPFKRKAEGGMAGYNKGGDIKGRGGPKDDSIPAELEEKSFIVPNENLELARIIRASMFPETTGQTASLKDGKSTAVPVKVSNGEHKFTKDEKEIMVNELGEEILEELAPNAEEMNDGGTLPGYKNGGDPKKKDATKAVVEAERGRSMKRRDEYIKELNELERKANMPGATWVDKRVYANRSPELSKYISEINRTYNIEEQDAAAELNAAKNLNRSMRVPVNTSTRPGNVTTQDVADIDSKYLNSIRPGLYGDNPNEPQIAPEYVSPQQKTTPYTGVDPNLALYDRDMAARLAELETEDQQPAQGQGQGQNTNWNDALGGLINYGIPALQVGMGLRNLKKAGDRPVDQLDPDFLRSVSRSAGTAAEAKQRASYGFDPETLAYLNQQNQLTTQQQLGAARNYSGGSAANALSLSGAALGDSYGRMLSTKVGDANAKNQKYGDYLNAQRYNDQLIRTKADDQQRLFNNSLRSWEQDTSSAANLAATGFSNAIEAYRGDQRLKNFNKIMSQSNPYQY